jgi:fluoride exporter
LISHKDPRALAAIFLGGALGALARVGLSQIFPARNGTFPYAIFAINVVGAFILGYAVTYLHKHHSDPTIPRAFVGIGFCGAFTTFSTMQLQLFEMLKLHAYVTAVTYIVASVVVGYAAVLASVALANGRVRG